MTHSKVTVGTSGTLLFSGTGYVKISPSGGPVALGGDNTVTWSTGLQVSNATAADFYFSAPGEIYGAGNGGSQDVRVLSWF